MEKLDHNVENVLTSDSPFCVHILELFVQFVMRWRPANVLTNASYCDLSAGCLQRHCPITAWPFHHLCVLGWVFMNRFEINQSIDLFSWLNETSCLWRWASGCWLCTTIWKVPELQHYSDHCAGTTDATERVFKKPPDICLCSESAASAAEIVLYNLRSMWFGPQISSISIFKSLQAKKKNNNNVWPVPPLCQ